MENRANIPAAVRRQLRQESGFGCCVCGHPFIQYHHIIPYAEEAHFRPEDMMALCPNDHDLCTKGVISQQEQRESKRRPRNIADNLLRGILYVNSNDLRIELAGGLAINTPNLIVYREDIHILGAKRSTDGRVLVSAIIQDRAGEVVAKLIENQWFALPDQIWDFECGADVATLRSAPREIAFKVDCRDNLVRLQGNWFLGQTRISFSPTECRVGGMVLQGFTVTNCENFLCIN